MAGCPSTARSCRSAYPPSRSSICASIGSGSAAAGSGIGRGTLYQYFTNKRSVLTAILRETLERVHALMQRQSAAVAYPPAEQVTRSTAIAVSAKQLRRVLAVVFEDGDTLRILLREAV